MSEKNKIRSKDLREWYACDSGRLWFAERFPDGATVDELEAALRQYGETGEAWLVWLARNMAVGVVDGDNIDRRLSWCRDDLDRAYLARNTPVGLPGDSLERRLSWCVDDTDRAIVRRRYAGLIPESV
jgi:hypothetical protein